MKYHPQNPQIDHERQHIKKEIRRSLFYMITTTVAAALTFAVLMIALPKIFHDWIWQKWYFLPWPIATGTAMLLWHLGDHYFGNKKMKDALDGLNITPASKAEELIRICETNPDCEKYRLAVIMQGRQILHVEFQNMRLKAVSDAEKKAQSRLYGRDTTQKGPQPAMHRTDHQCLS